MSDNISWLKKQSSADCLNIRRGLYPSGSCNRMVANAHNSLMGNNISMNNLTSSDQKYVNILLPRRKSVLPPHIKKQMEEDGKRKSRGVGHYRGLNVSYMTPNSKNVLQNQSRLDSVQKRVAASDLPAVPKRRETFVRPLGPYPVLQSRPIPQPQVQLQVYMSTPRSILKTKTASESKPKIDFRPGVSKQVNFDEDYYNIPSTSRSSKLPLPPPTVPFTEHSSETRNLMRETLDDGVLPLLESTGIAVNVETAMADAETNTTPITAPVSPAATVDFTEYKENMNRFMQKMDELYAQMKEYHKSFLDGIDKSTHHLANSALPQKQACRVSLPSSPRPAKVQFPEQSPVITRKTAANASTPVRRSSRISVRHRSYKVMAGGVMDNAKRRKK